MRIFKQIMVMLAAVSLMSALAINASALEYEFDSEAPGQTFYNSTSTDINVMGDADQVVVGMDGTISNNLTGNVSSGPLSFLDLPVGEYPDAWGSATDLAIAQNTMIPNELGPTSNTTAIYTPTYMPVVMSGALPTGAGFVPAAGAYGSFGAYNAPVSFGAPTTFKANGVSYSAAPSTTGAGAAPAGVSTQNVSMPTITDGGAIGRLTIPSIGLNKYVYEGTSQSNMRKGLAHFDSTSGYLGNIAIAGHNRGGSAYFAKLKDVQMGDTVQYTTAYGTMNYIVSNITECATSDVSGLSQDGSNKITMYTCKANKPEVKLMVVATAVGANA